MRAIIASFLLVACASSADETDYRSFTAPDGTEQQDVVDVDGDVIRFTSAGELEWTATGQRAPGYTFSSDGIDIQGTVLGVRFGQRDGQTTAFIVEPIPNTVCDVRIEGGLIEIFPTDMPLPM